MMKQIIYFLFIFTGITLIYNFINPSEIDAYYYQVIPIDGDSVPGYCSRVCYNRGAQCVSIGTDTEGKNNTYWNNSATQCVQTTPHDPCGHTFSSRIGTYRIFCSGKRVEWSNCRCRSETPLTPTPTRPPPTPTPTTAPLAIIKSEGDLGWSCVAVCLSVNAVCESAGTDPDATNRMYWSLDGSYPNYSCTEKQMNPLPFNSCNYKPSGRVGTTMCAGGAVDWTNCRCVNYGLLTPTPPESPLATPTPQDDSCVPVDESNNSNPQDYSAWTFNFHPLGATVSGGRDSGDLDCNGVSDPQDYSVWARYYSPF